MITIKSVTKTVSAVRFLFLLGIVSNLVLISCGPSKKAPRVVKLPESTSNPQEKPKEKTEENTGSKKSEEDQVISSKDENEKNKSSEKLEKKDKENKPQEPSTDSPDKSSEKTDEKSGEDKLSESSTEKIIEEQAELSATEPAEPQCTSKENGDIISQNILADKSVESVSSLATAFKMPAQYDVRVVKVVYCTPGVRRKLVPASGAVFIPLEGGSPKRGALSVLSYQHGTQLVKSNGPSNLETLDALGVVTGVSITGFVAVAADYLGLGESKMAHPYLHARTEASATASLLIALKNLNVDLEIEVSNHLYLLGYSQGGHATMALHRFLEQENSYGFLVKASAPMAGPYDLIGVSLEEALSNPSKSTPYYAAYLVQGMRAAYGIYEDVTRAIREKYAEKVMPLFEVGEKGSDEYEEVLPQTVTELFTEELGKSAVSKDKDNPFLKALEANTIYKWAPKAPTRLYHARADKNVHFKNSEVSFKKMKELGAKDIKLIDLGDKRHSDAILPAFKAALTWFEEIKSSTKGQ